MGFLSNETLKRTSSSSLSFLFLLFVVISTAVWDDFSYIFINDIKVIFELRSCLNKFCIVYCKNCK